MYCRIGDRGGDHADHQADLSSRKALWSLLCMKIIICLSINMAYLTADHPDYGDIIVFKSHIQRDDGKGDKLLIKRVVGVENDVIDIHDGVVYRNGTALDEPYTKEGYTEGDISDYKVPADQVFVMGDNRRVSLDSRSEEVGTVSEDSIVGKAFIRLYPFNQIKLL